jgi:hypothetical protein
MHYACTDTKKSPVIVTCISIKNYNTRQTTTFNVDSNTTESQILSKFVEFLKQHLDAVIITWNQKSSTYGFPHLEQRCKTHNIVTTLPILTENIVDLDDVLEEKFGKHYVEHPKFRKIAELNGITLTGSIDGENEPRLYENKEYRLIEISTNRKVAVITDILDLSFANKLIISPIIKNTNLENEKEKFLFAKKLIPPRYFEKLMKIKDECECVSGFEEVETFAKEMASRASESVIGTTDTPLEEVIEKTLMKRVEEDGKIFKENVTSSFKLPSAELSKKYEEYGFEWLPDNSREAYLATFVVDDKEAGFLFPQKDEGFMRFNWNEGYYTTKNEHIKLIREITEDIFAKIRAKRKDLPLNEGNEDNTVRDNFDKSSPHPKPESAPETKPSAKSEPKAKKSVFFYLILLPSIYGLVLFCGGNVLHFISSHFSTNINYFDYVFYTGLPFWAVMGPRYSWKWKKTDTEKYFKIFDHDYIITERLLLEKIKKISIITVIILLAVLSTHSYIDKSTKQSNELSVYELLTFSISYAIFTAGAFTYAKIQDQEKKKNFKLFLASGFFRKALRSEGRLQVKYLTEGLTWYSLFFRKTHKQYIGEIDKICIVLLSKKSHISSIQKLIQYFDSGEEYAAINEIAKLMKVKVDELFTKYSLFKKFNDLAPLIGIIVVVIQIVLSIMTHR